jgi:hypothetical protein
MNKIATGFTLAAAMMMVGCIASYENTSVDNDRFERAEQLGSGFGGNIDLTDGRLQGEIGRVDIDNQSPELSGFDDGGFAYIEVLGAGNNGVAMNIVELNGGLDHPSLTDGFTGTFSYDDYFEAEEGDLRVMSLGCSGDEAYAWDYDQPASETTIEVLEVEEGLRVDYISSTERVDPMTGVSTGEMQSSEGSFVIQQ